MLLASAARYRRSALAMIAGSVVSLLGARAAEAEESEAPQALAPAVQAPHLTEEVSVPYPEGAQGNAEVVLKLLISLEGEVADVQLADGQEPFAGQAMRAARDWAFSPALVNSKPQAAWILFRVQFEEPQEFEEPAALAQEVGSTTAVPSGDEAEALTDAETDTEYVVEVRTKRVPGIGRVISDEETQLIPGAEGDPIRAVEAMPGSVPVLVSGPFLGLRGASPGMVGYEYDGISLPYLFHLARGPAVVHPWLVESASIYGTGGPGRLGRANGGTIEARAAEPEGRRRAQARVRLTDAALGVEAPFADGRGNVLLGGRFSYTKLLVSLIAPDFGLNFWDYQSRVRFELSPQDRLEVLALGAGDRSSVLEEGEPPDDLFNGQFHRASLRYTRSFADGEYYRSSITYSHDRWDGRSSPIRPSSNQLSFRVEGGKPVSEQVSADWGTEFAVRNQSDSYYVDQTSESTKDFSRNDSLGAAWVDLGWRPSRRTRAELGVRFDIISTGNTVLYDSGTGAALQPRFSFSHLLTKNLRFHNSFGLSVQPSSPTERPPGRVGNVSQGLQRSALLDAGVEFQLPADFTFDATAFQNSFFNVADIEEIRFLEGQDWSVGRGQGSALGFELALRRVFAARWRGFLNYTYSRSRRSLGRVTSFAKYDRPHVVDGALAYDFGSGWSATARAMYYAGYFPQVVAVEDVEAAPRSDAYYQIDWQVAKRWELNQQGAYWAVTVGMLNTTLNSDVSDYTCDQNLNCEQELVGPASIPTIGVEGEL